MTDKEKIELEIAIQHLRNIRNNIPNVSSINQFDAKWYLQNTWVDAMNALSILESLTKTTT